MDKETEILTEHLAESISKISYVLEILGGQFIIEVKGEEFLISDFTIAGNEIIMHADVD